MIKTYSYSKDGNKYLSKHFQVKEFASFGNGKLYSDTILIDDELVNKLEYIFNTLRASKCIISSGYRTRECDIAVGGSGQGQHVNGRAADCCYYDKQGKPIPSKIVCCVAWDIHELNGIARIDNNYVHLDNRKGSTYYGDEPRGNSSYWTNPYEYFGVTKAEVAKYTGGEVPSENVYITYQIWDDVKNAWLPNVTNSNDFAGVFGHDVCCIYANANIGNVYYKVHVKGSNWLPEVMNRNDFAGLYNKPIDGFMIKSNKVSLKYRVHIRRENRWLGWVTGYNTDDGINGFAGIIGQEIDGIQIGIK